MKDFKKFISIVLAICLLTSMTAVATLNTSAAERPTSVVLDVSGVNAGNVDWRAWTWKTDGIGHWVSAGNTTSTNITYDNVDENIIFAYFQHGSPVDSSWTGKIGQTNDLTVSGNKFTVTSVGSGTVSGVWSTVVNSTSENAASEDTNSEVTTSESGYSEVNTENSVVLDASAYPYAVEWYAWTWPEGDLGHWVSAHGTSAADITFDSLDKNVIFACFPWENGTPDSSWSNKIAQTNDLTVDGNKFTVTSVDNGVVTGTWSSEIPVISEAGASETATSETATSEAATSEAASEASTSESSEAASSNTSDSALIASIKLNGTEVKSVKVTGTTLTVSYNLKADKLITDGDFSLAYDGTKLSLKSIDFPNTTYNLTKSPSLTANPFYANFTGVNSSTYSGAYDFKNGAVLVKAVFNVAAGASGTTEINFAVVDLDSLENRTNYNHFTDYAFVSSDENVITSLSNPTVEQSGEPLEPDISESASSESASGYTVVLDASRSGIDALEWYCWTWTDSTDGHWVVGHGTSAADIKFSGLEKNVIFACFPWGNGIPDISWTDKYAQTDDLTVYGAVFTVTNVSNGLVDGTWSGIPSGGSTSEATTSEVSTSEAATSEQSGSDIGNYTVYLDAFQSGLENIEWKAWTWTDSNNAHWATSTGSASGPTFQGLYKNVVFACFQKGTDTPDSSWSGIIAQTTDMKVIGSIYTVTSVNNGTVNGYWANVFATSEASASETSSSETSTSEDSTSEATTSEAAASEAVTSEASTSEDEPVDDPDVTALISVDKAQAFAGDTVEVPIRISDNPGIISMTLKLNYNSSALELLEVKDGGILGNNSHKPELESPYTLVWANDSATTNFTANGVIATLKFKVKDNTAVGNYPVKLSYDYDNYDIYDKDLEIVKFNIHNNVVEVTDYVIGDVNGDKLVNNLDRAYLTRYLANWNDYKNINLKAADVNLDGSVNNLDRAILTRYLAHWANYSSLPYSG